MSENEQPCCSKFDPKPWNEQELIWKDKLFVKDHVTCAFHIPVNMKQKMQTNMELIKAANAKPDEFFMLTEQKTPWGMDIYIEVTKEIPNCQMLKLSGTFLAKVFEGPYANLPKWHKEMEQYVKEKGKTSKTIYTFFTTCPKCARIFGKNYVVFIAQIE